jgi:hypothetical protein
MPMKGETVSVAWLRRPGMERVWCRAAHKKIESYQDSVKTACGQYVIFPCGTSASEKVTCEDCIEKEVQGG